MGAGDISFAGPGKRDRELEAAIAAGATLNLESAGEGERALSIASHLDVTPRLAVRRQSRLRPQGIGDEDGRRR